MPDSNDDNDLNREPIELEAADIPFEHKVDRRPRLFEPLPVNLIAITDITHLAGAATHDELDAFYRDMLEFEKESDDPLVYRADNFRLRFAPSAPAQEFTDMKPTGIIVRSLPSLEMNLIEREIPYTRQKSLAPGRDSLLLLDPSGNWIEATEQKPF